MKLLAVTSAVILTLGLAACSVTAPIGDPPDDRGTGDSAAPNEDTGNPDVCGGLTTADLSTIFGVDLEGPDPSTGDSDQNGTTWTSTGCDWENDQADFEIDLDISGATDFPDGTIVCIAPGGVGDVTSVDGIGTQAWWKFDDFNEVEGELRVCTDDSLVELAVDAQSGSATSDELREKVTSAIRIVID